MPRPGFGQSRLPGRPQELRQQQTSAEETAWAMLRARQLRGLKFRRQFPIAVYIVDFCCHERRLVVELDGAVHAEPEQIAHDRNRDAYLRASGYKVLRFANRELFEDPERVLRRIAEEAGVGYLSSDGLTPDPSPIALPPDRERGATTPPPGSEGGPFSVGSRAISDPCDPEALSLDSQTILCPSDEEPIRQSGKGAPAPSDQALLAQSGQGIPGDSDEAPIARGILEPIDRAPLFSGADAIPGPASPFPPSPGGREGDGRGGSGG